MANSHKGDSWLFYATQSLPRAESFELRCPQWPAAISVIMAEPFSSIKILERAAVSMQLPKSHDSELESRHLENTCSCCRCDWARQHQIYLWSHLLSWHKKQIHKIEVNCTNLLYFLVPCVQQSVRQVDWGCCLFSFLTEEGEGKRIYLNSYYCDCSLNQFSSAFEPCPPFSYP